MKHEIYPSEVIRPKTYRPNLSPVYLHRERLLNEVTARQYCPLILISGPAGYGKTTLMSAWLSSIAWPVAWISLDQADNNLHLFLQYVVAAIREHFPKAMQKTAALLHSITLPDVAVVARVLINDLDHIKLPYILALDDYHLISEPAIHEIVDQILRNPPRTFHLALATRHDPPLGLSNLRAHGRLAEIRMGDLRFTDEESSQLLQQVAGMELSASTVAIMIEQIDGWAAGLHMAGLRLRNKPASLRLKPRAVMMDNSLMQFLFDEVLQQQPLSVQEFLMRTSILDELNQPLCNAVTGQGNADCDSEPCLAHLVKHNLFVSSVNEDEGRYRYHQLFQKLLREQLERQCSMEQIAELHKRASDWHAVHGQPENALRYALQVKDYARAGQIIGRYRHQLMNDDQWQRLDHWLRQIPPEVIAASPDLMVADAYIAHVRFRRGECVDLLSRVDNLIAAMPASADRDALCGEAACLRAQYLYERNEFDLAITTAQLGLRLTPHDRWHGRIVAWLIGSMARLAKGDHAEALERIYQAFFEEQREGDGLKMRLYLVLCFVHSYTANLSNQQQVAIEAMRYGIDPGALSSEPRWSNILNWVRYHLGMGHYYRNELAEAEAVLSDVVEQRYQSHLNCAIQSMFIISLIHQAHGKFDAANDVADLAMQHALEMRGTLLLPSIEAFKAQLALLQGRISDAAQRVAVISLPETLSPMWVFYIPYLTFAQVHLAVGTDESLQCAETILSSLQAHAEKQHNPRLMMAALAKGALLAEARGDTRAALMTLERALLMAQAEGYIRIFTDLGPRMFDLLERLHSRTVSSQFIRRVHDAFTTRRPSGEFPTQVALIEPLTNRELEVLALLHKRMRAKEIADSLYISPGTVKRHIHAIYQKLDVSSRREAVIKAMALELLTVQ